MTDNRYHGNLEISSAPHQVGPVSTTKIMGLVLLALVPAFAVGIYQFGYRTITLTAVCVAACVILEYLMNRLLKRRQTVGDLSAVVTGVLLAFNLPAGFPYWMAVVGCIIAIVIVKQLFGGIGQNIVNPAVTARVFLLIAFATEMTTWPTARGTGLDAVTSATPLGELATGGMDAVSVSNMDLFLGNVGGCIGEVSALALLIGGIFLICTRVISIHIPLSFLGTVFVCGFIWGGLEGAIFQVCAGGAMLGAFFCATDYVTSPMLPAGKVIFGIGCGLFTMLIRLFATYPEGVSFAILLMNILTPYIDRVTEKLACRSAEAKRKGDVADEK